MKKTSNFLRRLSSASGLLKTSFVIASFTLLGTGAAIAQSSGPIGVSGKAGDFEIDADFIPTSCTNTNICSSTGTDWRAVLLQDPNNSGLAIPGISDVAGENAKWIVDGNSGSGVSASNHEVETFAGTSNKNGDYVTLGASPYSIDTSNPSTPQKNDLTNIYVRSKEVAGKTWLVMGAETRSVDGTSYLDFEYNQAGMARSGTQMYGPISLANHGGRTAKNGTAGDALFVVDFSKGGGVPIPKVFEWRSITKGNKTSYAWVEIPIPAGKAYIVTNGNNVAPAGLNTAFAGNGAASNTTLALQFVEMGVNLTDLFGNFNPCAPEATMLVKTRTSSSYTSELKDFSLFDFAITPNATIDDIDNVAVCPSQDATFDATVSGPGASAANVHWYKVTTPDDPATPADEEVLSAELVTGGRITISTSGSTSTLKIAGVIAGDEGTYKATLSGSTCGAAPKYADLTLNTVDTPVITLLEPSVCEARATGLLKVCNPLEGANYYVEQVDANGDTVVAYHQEVLVYDPLNGELTFDLVPGYIFKLKVEKNGCEERVDCGDLATEAECTAASARIAPKPLQHEEESLGNNSDLRQDQTNTVHNQTLTAYPVPFSEKVNIKFTAEKSESYVINLYNMQGKLIKELKSGNAKAGELIQMEVNGKGMIESLYVVKKISQSGISTIKIFKSDQ